MADYQIGDNLYADSTGKYYNLNNGAKSFVDSPFDTLSNKLNQVYDQQRKTQLDQLRQQRDKAIGGFNQQKKELAPVYQNQRNQADVVNAQNVTRLRELMAANGINASGENLTTQANMASSRQSALGEITNNENMAYRDIDRQIAEVNDPSREQSIYNNIETERSKALADAYAQSQQDIYQRYIDWRNYQMQLKEMEEAAKARAASSRRSSGGSSTNVSSTPQATASVQAYNQVKSKQPTSAIDRYYSSPAIQKVEAMKAKNNSLARLFGDPVPPAQSPYLTAWEKMRMFQSDYAR